MAVQTTEEFLSAGSTSYATNIEKLKDTDLKVRIGGALQTYVTSNPSTGQYTVTNNPTTIVLGAAASGEVHIYRETDIETPAAVFVAGSSIRANDLNNIHDMARFAAVEHRNNIITADIKDGQITSAKILDGTIVDADINASAAIANTKIATGLLPSGITVNSDNIVNGSIVNDDVNNSAAIAGTKISPDFGSQVVQTTGNIVVGGTVDGRDIATDGTKLDGIEPAATIDQTAAEIKTLLQSDKLTDSEIATGTLDNRYYTETELNPSANAGQNVLDGRYYTETELATDGLLDGRYFTETELTQTGLLDGRYYTETELLNDGVLDSRYLSESAADARYFNISSGDTIKDGDVFPDNDITIASTAAINDRIIDLIDEVGGFVPIANETSFPTANPDANNGAGTIVSVKTASTTLTPSGTTVTITNGAGTGNTVTITGVTDSIPQDFGFLVETTTTLHTYTFHRLVPKATEVTTVASNIAAINSLNANASNINTTAGDIANVNTVAGDITNVNTVGANIVNVNAVANSLGAAQTFTVTVSGGVFYINGVANPSLTLTRGFTYTFDQSDSTNNNHPLAFRDNSNASYTTGLTVNGTAGQTGSTVIFVVPSTAPNSLIYYCTQHGNSMGNTISIIDDTIGIVAGNIGNVNTTAGNISSVNAVSGSLANVNTVANNLGTVNDFAARYSSGASNPTTNLDTGDLFFNTTANELKIYNGGSWQGGVTAQGSLYNNNSVDTHLNQSNPTSGYVLSWNGSDYAWVDNAGFTNTDVDTHLNQSNPTSGYVLSWNGSDYAWVASTDTTYSAGSGLSLNGTTFSVDTLNQNTTGTSGGFTAGDASNLNTGTIPDQRFPATLPVTSGANLSDLNASNLTSGTIPDVVFPATLPAISGANLTHLPSSGGGLIGGGTDELFIESDNVMSTDFTTGTNKNYINLLPLSVNATLTVTDGSFMQFVSV